MKIRFVCDYMIEAHFPNSRTRETSAVADIVRKAVSAEDPTLRQAAVLVTPANSSVTVIINLMESYLSIQ